MLGRAGENGFRTLTIDWEAWKKQYPAGTITVVVKRADGTVYPAVTGVADCPYEFSVTSAECGAAGAGQLEVRLICGETVGKSALIPTVVYNALTATGTPPEPEPDWLDDVIGAAATAAARAAAAASSSESAAYYAAEAALAVGRTSYIGQNGNWFQWDAAVGAFTDSGAPSRGERGYSGLVPAVTVPYAAAIVLSANVMTTIGELTGSCAITLAAGPEGYDNEWDAVIAHGAAAHSVTLPTVSWGCGAAPAFEPGSVTVIRLYRVGETVCGEWAVV